MKRLFTNWKVWAAAFFVLFALLVIVILNYPMEVEVERRDYITLDEYNNIDIGMTFDEFLNVQEAKPSKDGELISEDPNTGETVVAVQYDGLESTAFCIVYIKTDEEGNRTVLDKSQSALTNE